MSPQRLSKKSALGRIVRGRCGVLAGVMFLFIHALPAQPAAQNVWWYPDDPFVTTDLRAIGTLSLPDWTSHPSGSSSAPSLVVERIGPTGALEQPSTRSLAPAPPGSTFALVNQYANDISVFALTAPAPKSAPGDMDGNGLSDVWEQRHFNRLGADPAADPDGDGFTNLAEFEAGTDPMQASSRPSLPGVLGIWSAENSAEDSAGGHHGSWIGTPTYTEGRIGRAFSVTATRSVRIPDAADLRVGRAISIAAWIRLAQTTCNLQPILARLSSRDGQPGFGLSVNCSGIRFALASEFASSLEGPVLTLSTGVWYHVAATWDGTNTLIYLNGRIAFGLRRAAGFGPLDLPVGRDLRIGSDGSTQSFEGALDQVVLADRSLTGEEIRWLAGGNDGQRGAIPDSSLVVEREDQSVWRLNLSEDTKSFLTHGHDAHLSADRRRLVFRRAQTSPGDLAPEHLWLRDLVSGEEAPLFSLAQSGDRVSIDWAADGAAIIVTDAIRRRIERYSLNEGPASTATLLADTASLGSPSELSVSREGGHLAWFLATGVISLDGPWTAESNGENPKLIRDTQASQFLLRYHRPSWSPDGSKLALLSGGNLLEIRPDGTARAPLTFHTGQAAEPAFSDVAPAWTVSSDYLVTVANFPQRDPRTRVVYVAADGSGQWVERTSDGAPPIRVVFGGMALPRFLWSCRLRSTPPLKGTLHRS